MKSKLITLLLSIALIISLLPSGLAEAKTYTIKDVDEYDEAYESIQDVLNQGWMDVVLNKFYPDKYITRGEFAYILTKFNGQLNEAKGIKKTSFKDVTLDYQYGKYIELQKKNVTYYKTAAGNYFKPKNYVTREDALVAIVKVLGYDSDAALDEGVVSEIDIEEILEDADKISSALKSYVVLGVTNQLIDLTEENDLTYLRPKKSITRRQMAQLLVNARDARDYMISGDESESITTDDADDEDSDSDAITTDSDSENNSSDNTKGSSSSSTSNSTVNNELGYIKVNLNGKDMVYKQKESESLGQYWDFYSDKYSTNNMFSISLPTDIASGDSITIDSAQDTDLFLSYPMDVQYVNSKGERFLFGYPLGHYDGGEHRSSKVIITITENGGKGGYLSGTIYAEIILSDGEVIMFTDGEFKYKIKGSDF